MITLQVKTNLKKYAKMEGYVANTYSPYAMLKHLCFKFNISEYEIKKAHKSGKVVLVWIS
jgi:hypothetical protein